MIKQYKNRTINHDKPVKVYWNIHLDCYSLKQSGKVVAHADKVELRDVTFKVNESGRQRVLKERRKNVHAFITGYIDEHFVKRDWDIKIVYNPYKYDSFRLWASDSVTVTSADAVCLGIRNGKSEILADRDVT